MVDLCNKDKITVLTLICAIYIESERPRRTLFAFGISQNSTNQSITLTKILTTVRAKACLKATSLLMGVA